MKRSIVFIAVALGAMLSGCSTSTRITGSWVEPSAKAKISAGKTVFLACLTRNIEVRTKLENELAAQAALRNIKTVKSTDYFSPDFYRKLPAEKELITKIKTSGADAILTISLIKKESENRYIPGARMYAPFPYYGWYGGFYRYYSYWHPMFYDPGYYVTDKTYFMETNLYDVEKDQLMWSAQSETVNPGPIDNFVKTYPAVLIGQLVKDGVLKL